MTIRRKHARKQGDIGVGVAISWFIRNGYTINIPLSDSQRYDLIVDKDDILYRVQVKTSTCLSPSGNYAVCLLTAGGNRSWSGITHYFDKKICELLFVLTDDENTYLIPTTKLHDNACTITEGPWKETDSDSVSSHVPLQLGDKRGKHAIGSGS